MFKVIIDGQKYLGFKDISVSYGVTKMQRNFSIGHSVKMNGFEIINPIKTQSKVEIFIDDEKILTGIVEDVESSYNINNHSLTAEGRSNGKLVDSSIIQKQYSQRDFVKLLRLVLDDNGYSAIKIVNDLEKPALMATNEEIRTDENDTIFSFIDKYSQRLQVFVYTDADGDLVVSTEGFEGAGGSLISEIDGRNNNILEASYRETIANRFSIIEVYAQELGYKKISVYQKGSATDNEITDQRRKIVIAGKATSKDVLDLIAKFHVTANKAKGRTYRVKVVGHYTGRNNGLLWQPNTIVSVKDDINDLNGQFLISEVTFSQNSNGSFTDLDIVDLGSFSIDPDKKFDYVKRKRRDKFFKQ